MRRCETCRVSNKTVDIRSTDILECLQCYNLNRAKLESVKTIDPSMDTEQTLRKTQNMAANFPEGEARSLHSRSTNNISFPSKENIYINELLGLISNKMNILATNDIIR